MERCGPPKGPCRGRRTPHLASRPPRTAWWPSSAASPFTTFELAALQSLVDPEEQLELEGLSDAEWRERIGNAVPPDAAMAIADTMGKTLLLAWSGESFMLSALPIWVRPIGVAMSLDQP